jgi:hypothetical protein
VRTRAREQGGGGGGALDGVQAYFTLERVTECTREWAMEAGIEGAREGVQAHDASGSM